MTTRPCGCPHGQACMCKFAVPKDFWDRLARQAEQDVRTAHGEPTPWH